MKPNYLRLSVAAALLSAAAVAQAEDTPKDSGIGLPDGLDAKLEFSAGWGFFGFSGEQPASLIPQAAACYACHQDHAAVDTTFVQFYPTLLPVSATKATLSAAYLAEEKAKAGTK